MMVLIEFLIAGFLVISGFFGFVGSFGLWKLPDLMTRLHAPTKATTLGVGGVLIASMMVAFFIEGRLSLHELLITIFLLLTAPIAALFLAKAHIHRHAPELDLPAPGEDQTWATLDMPDGDATGQAD